MRSADEIKKGLELCYKDIDCSECPYVDDCFGNDETPFGAVMPDALVLIQQLESDVHFYKVAAAPNNRVIAEQNAIIFKLQADNAELSGKIGQLEANNKLLQDAVDQWELVAASPGAVEDMARENTELLKKVEQLQAERDAAVADLEHVKDCDSCKYDDACFTGKKDCFGCHEKRCPCLTCQYEWRGVQK